MPFAVFRRHQRKLLAIFAILAMFGFVLADSLPALLRSGGLLGGGGAPEDAEVVKLYGRSVRRSDLARMAQRRQRANAFMNRLVPGVTGQFFGGTSTRELVDALILEHEANQLGLPDTKEYGNRWLNALFSNRLKPEDFDRALHAAFETYSGDAMLEDIASQVRLFEVRKLPGRADVSPLDVFDAYRDQYERVSANFVAFPVADYVSKVPAPSDPEVRAFFERYKDTLPDPKRDTPGFKIPRKIRVEYVSIDASALARDIRAKLSEKELREAFEARPKEFARPEPELPIKLFAGPDTEKLTPDLRGDAFREMRPLVESTLAEERAREIVDAKFNAVREDAMDPFADEYANTLQENQESSTKNPLPKPDDRVKQIARKQGLTYERSPHLERSEAEIHGTISGARSGAGGSLGEPGVTFADTFFDPKKPLFEPAELSDFAGRRFLAWKVEDLPARVPPLDEVRDKVVHAWKMEKGRALAESDARAVADAARTKGDLKAAAGSRVAISTSPVTKLTPGFFLPPSNLQPARPGTIPQIPDAGENLRDAFFDLQPKQVAVAPNAPKTVYYVLTLNERIPARFEQLYDPYGVRFGLEQEVAMDAQRRLDEDWLHSLRSRAGLPENWSPPDERNRVDSPIGG